MKLISEMILKSTDMNAFDVYIYLATSLKRILSLYFVIYLNSMKSEFRLWDTRAYVRMRSKPLSALTYTTFKIGGWH